MGEKIDLIEQYRKAGLESRYPLLRNHYGRDWDKMHKLHVPEVDREIGDREPYINRRMQAFVDTIRNSKTRIRVTND